MNANYTDQAAQTLLSVADRRVVRAVCKADGGWQVEPTLTGVAVTTIAADPTDSNTLFAGTQTDGIYRSTDGGTGWMRLTGGLPADDQSTWTVGFSPDYAADRTIYAAGYRGDYWGDGVWRSQDGGDIWQALWDNLVHRRISRLHFSPDFATNDTLVAQAKFFDGSSVIGGDSYQQSTDGGLSWTLVVTGNYASPAGEVPLPPVSELLPGAEAAAALPVRMGPFGDSLEFTLDNSSWQTATFAPGEQQRILSLAPAPGYPEDPAIFAFSTRGIWRTADGGTTWEPMTDGKITMSSVGALGVCQSNPDVVYIGGGEVAFRGNIIQGDGVYRTTDGGKTWPVARELVNKPGDDAAYPYIIQTADGKIHGVFTSQGRSVVNHFVLDEADVAAAEAARSK